MHIRKGMWIPLGHLGQNLISVWLQGIYNSWTMSLRVLGSLTAGHWHDPNTIGDGHHQSSSPAHWTWGVAPCKVLNCKKLQLFGISEQLPLTASMFHSVTSCDSTLNVFCLNFSKTSEKGGRSQEHVCFIIRHGAARPNVDSIHIWESTAMHRLRSYH